MRGDQSQPPRGRGTRGRGRSTVQRVISFGSDPSSVTPTGTPSIVPTTSPSTAASSSHPPPDGSILLLPPPPGPSDSAGPSAPSDAAEPSWVRCIRKKTKRPAPDAPPLPARPRTRGPTQSSWEKKVRANGGNRLVVAIDTRTGHPTEPYGQTFALAIGSWIRDQCPMTADRWGDHNTDELRDRIIHFLLTYFHFDPEEEIMQNYILDRAQDIYREWKHQCFVDVVENGPEPPVPIEFEHRIDQWRWLLDHFETPEYKTRSEAMKALRGSRRKLNHSSGPVPFPKRAVGHMDEGHPAPFVQTFVDMYGKLNPDIAGGIQAALNERLQGTVPPGTEGSSDTPPPPVELSYEEQAELLASQGQPSRGTRVPGFGQTHLDPKKRGKKSGQCSSSSSTHPEDQARMGRLEEELVESRRQIEESRRHMEELATALEESRREQARVLEESRREQARALEETRREQALEINAAVARALAEMMKTGGFGPYPPPPPPPS